MTLPAIRKCSLSVVLGALLPALGAYDFPIAQAKYAEKSRPGDDGKSLILHHFSYFQPGVSFGKIPAKRGAFYEFSADVTALRTERNAFYAQVTFDSQHEKYHSIAELIFKKETKNVRFIFQVPPDSERDCIDIGLYSRVTGSGLICRNFKLQEVKRPESRELILTSPAFRGNIYQSHPVRTISGFVRAYPEPARVTLSLRRGDQVLARSTGKSFSFPVADNWKEGVYLLRAELFDRNGRKSGEMEQKIRKMPPSPVEVVIGQDRNFYVNGKIFHPLITGATDLERNRTAAQNGITVFTIRPNTEEEARAAFAAANRDGYKVLIANYYHVGGDPENDLKRWFTRISSIIPPDLLKDPALFAWILKDEPAILGEPFAPLLDAYRKLREYDPYRPIFLNEAPEGSVEQNRVYSEASDIYGMDIYPVGRRMHGSIGEPYSLTSVGACAEVCGKAVEDRKPVWLYLQAYAWHQKNPVYPDLTQSRFMFYDSFFHDVKGILYFGISHPGIRRHSFLPVLFRSFNEIRLVHPVFASGKRVAEDFRNPVRTIELLYHGQRYLFAANYTTKEVTAQLRHGFPDGGIPVAFENRTVTGKNGRLTDRFAPNAVHVYTNDPAWRTLEVTVPEVWLSSIREAPEEKK